MERYIAKIISNSDPDEEGKVQIYVPHLMEGWVTSHYPWAKQDNSWTSFIPEVGEYVWVRFEDPQFLKKAYYGNKVTLKDYHDHAESIGSMSGSYPDIKYIKLANGVSIALNSSDTEASIVAGNAEIYISPDGEVKITAGIGQKILVSNGAISFDLLLHKHSGITGPPIPE